MIDIKKEKLKRLVEVSSSVVLKNLTNLPLEFIIFDQQGVHEKKSIQDQLQAAPIAFDNIQKTLMLSMKSSVSNKIALTTLLKSGPGSYRLPLVCPRGNYNNLKLEVTVENGITYIATKPALKIVNYSPDAIQYNLQHELSEDSNIIFRNKPVEIFKFDPYGENSILELTINDVFMTAVELRKVLQKRGVTTVKLLNCESKGGKNRQEDDDPERKIYLELFSDPTNNILIIYSKFNIFNETGLAFNVYSFKSSGMSKPRKAVENGSRNIIFMASQSHDTIIIKPTAKTFDRWPGVSQITSSHTAAFPRKLGCALNQKIAGGEGKGFFELNFVVIPNVVEVAEGILTKTITIAPKYVFVNSTNYSLCIIQSQCSIIHKVPPQGREALIWRSEQKSCSFQVEDESLNL